MLIKKLFLIAALSLLTSVVKADVVNFSNLISGSLTSPEVTKCISSLTPLGFQTTAVFFSKVIESEMSLMIVMERAHAPQFETKRIAVYFEVSAVTGKTFVENCTPNLEEKD